MENNSSFKFKLIDTVNYVSKSGKKGTRIIAFCSYGFLVDLFTTEDKAKFIIEKAKLKNNDITEFVYVFYDNNNRKFGYVINLK